VIAESIDDGFIGFTFCRGRLDRNAKMGGIHGNHFDLFRVRFDSDKKPGHPSFQLSNGANFSTECAVACGLRRLKQDGIIVYMHNHINNNGLRLFNAVRLPLLAAGALILFLAAGTGCSPKEAESVPGPGETVPLIANERLEGHVRAPDFPQGLEWLNTDKPLTLEGLRGKMVLLDFWTYCCINCMHVLPDLKKLEEKYPQELVVIGVHSGKFEAEKDPERIRQAILRYEITHPVVNDAEYQVWNSYSVRSWPTLVLINPNGRVIGAESGEGLYDVFDQIIGQSVAYFEKKGELKRSPLNLALEAAKQADSVLSFPGKIHADPKNNRLLITDSNHHRILITTPDGTVEQVIGSGEEGFQDGSFNEASFQHPQGVFLDGDTIYIADTENHAIRTAHLDTGKVETLFGTGAQGRVPQPGARGRNAALNSPWDLLVHEGILYIAMAGPHQLWTADPKSLEIKPYAGSGREARIDGPLAEAALAQPSGITTDGKRLYFADSEVSSVRAADLDPAGNVETLIGMDLFEFGDLDGTWPEARLQHPLGVVWKDGLVYVADTYNSKIKVIDPAAKSVTTLAGNGRQALKDGSFSEASFFEPGGLAFLDGKLYVADTNNHKIRVLDLDAKTITTMVIAELRKPS